MLILGRKPGEGVAIGLNDGFIVSQVTTGKVMVSVWHRERPGMAFDVYDMPLETADKLGKLLKGADYDIRLLLIRVKVAPVHASIGIEVPPEVEVLRIELLSDLQKENNIPLWAQHD